jgi:hypothetical protein
MIMREKVACRLPRRTLLVLGALALVLLPGFTFGQDKSKPGDPPKEELQWQLFFQNPADPPSPKSAPFRRNVLFSELDKDGAPNFFFLEDEPQDLFYLEITDTVDRDKKLAELEAKVQQLLKEIQALKSNPSSQAEMQKHIESATKYLRLMQQHQQLAKSPEQSATVHGLAVLALAQSKRKDGSVEVITLTRATYALPSGKAAALDALLKEHVKLGPLETKVDGDKLTVTTTPEMQTAIKGIVGLMQTQEKPK